MGCKATGGVEASEERWDKITECEADQHRHIDRPQIDEFVRELVQRKIDQPMTMRPGEYAGCSKC